MSGPWEHEWKTTSKLWPSSKSDHLVVDKEEADAHVAMLVKHCEQLAKRVEQLKQMLKDAQSVAKAWMDLATKKQTNKIQHDAAAYNSSLKHAMLAAKEAHHNIDELMAQLEAEGVVKAGSFSGQSVSLTHLDEFGELKKEHSEVTFGSQPASHALDAAKHGKPGIVIGAPAWPMPYAAKEAMPRWVPDGDVLAATKAAAGEVVQTTVIAHEVTHGEKPHCMIPYAKFFGNMAKVAGGKSFCQYDPAAAKLRVFLLINPHLGIGDLVVCAGIVGEQHAKIAHKALEFIAQGCVIGVYGKIQVAGKFVKWCENACLDVVLYACGVPSEAPWNGTLVEAPAKTKAKIKSTIVESSLADYVKWHAKMEAAQHANGLTTMIYDEEADPPKAGTWIHYDAFFSTLTLHAEDSAGKVLDHWTIPCPNKTRAAEAAEKFKELLDAHDKETAVTILKDWWYGQGA